MQVDRVPQVEGILVPAGCKLTPQMLLFLPDLRLLLHATFDRPEFGPSQALRATNMGHVRLQNLSLIESIGPDFPSQIELPALRVLKLVNIKVQSEFIEIMPLLPSKIVIASWVSCY